MTGASRTSHGLDVRRRRVLFRAWRRGTREMDLLMGGFADASIADLSEGDLADFEALLMVPDPDLYAWLTLVEAPPANYSTPVLNALIRFHHSETVQPG